MLLRLRDRLHDVLPEGRLLPDEVWHRRHRMIVRIALVQAVVLGLVALLRGESAPVALLEAGAVALPVVVAVLPGAGRALKAAAATLGLMAASILLIFLMDGLTEAHFHFFVMVGLVSLY